MQRGFDNIPEEGCSSQENQSITDIPGDKASHSFKEAKPFPNDDYEQDCSKDESKECEDRTHKRCERPGGRGRSFPGTRLRDGVPCICNRLADGREIDLGGINLEHRLLGSEQDMGVLNPWEGRKGALHMHATFCAIHSIDGDFELLLRHDAHTFSP